LGEGLARVITVGSIVLTAASLTLAVVFARKKTRIRVGFDVARAVIGITAIVVMAAITNVITPVIAVLVAVAVGVGLGFTQGSTLEISAGERGLYATRTPIALLGWGAGIILMQTAGIASRTGAVQLGQTVAWFSACMGIGLIVGRTRPLNKNLARTGVATVIIALAIPATVLFAGAGTRGPAIAAEGDRWVLAETRVNPNGAPAEFVSGVTPNYFGDPRFDGKFDRYTVTATGISSHRRDVDYGVELWNMESKVTFDTPPAVMIPGEVVTLSASGSVSGTENADWNPGEQFEIRADGVTLEGETYFAMGITPQRSPSSGSISPWFTVPPPSAEGVEIRIHAFYWNCAACSVEWVYRADIAPPQTTPQTDESTPSGSDDAPSDGVVSPTPITESSTPAAGDDGLQPGSAGPVTPEEAAAQAIAGVIAAAAIGLITWAEASAEIGQILGTLGSGGGSPPVRPGPTRTIYVSGEAAERVLQSGPGSTIPIPSDQQWDENVSVPGSPPVQSGRVGSAGVVRTIGPVVRGADGSVSVAVDVDAFDPVAPPPPVPPTTPTSSGPPTDVDGPNTPPDTPPPPPVPGLPPDTPPPPPPPVPGLPPDTPPPPPPVPGLPPDTPPPPPPVPGLPPDTPPPPPVPGPPPDTPPDAPPDAPPLEPPASGVVLDDREITDLVRWGVERNRSPEDIRQDLEGLNRARGGSGSVEFPEPLVQVDTDAGPVTVTASEAAAFERAAAEARRLEGTRANLRRDMAELDQAAARWGGAERMTMGRFAAGVQDMTARSSEVAALTAEIDAEIVRLNRRPDPMTFDFPRAGMATREEALESWQNRDSDGWHHDELQRLQGRRQSLNSQLTDELKRYSTVDETRVSHMRDALEGIEQGNSPPIQADFALHPDPQEEHARALEDWRTRDTSGRYFDEAERLRNEIAHRESLTHVSDVEPARPGDRGTIFDRPARELARIAEEQDRAMQDYREIDRRLDAARRVINNVTDRGRNG